ncbi:hypothetical protein ABID29_000493 [Streptococcus rupicaprae]|uniref:DUF5301 domain-containing protein n=1 Tax=Streptococcus rupicaprae TaxID=759619 RepID=A0ABV2FFX7_9STRE
MKKLVTLVSLGLVLLGLVFWYWSGSASGPAPSLPPADQLQSIALSTTGAKAYLVTEDHSLEISGPAEIASLLDYLSQANKTKEASVNDVPYGQRYVRLDFAFKDGESKSVAYLYPKAGTTYLEQPYTGIYKLQHPIENWLADRD